MRLRLAFSSLAVLTSFLLAIGCATSARRPMTQSRMEALIEELAQGLQGRAGAFEFTFEDVSMACISDVAHDRMRIIAPIVKVSDVPPSLLHVLLIANFHTALDGRYAVSDGILYAAFLHPLSSLSAEQIASALRQVSSLARTFGSSFSSGELSFGSETGQEL